MPERLPADSPGQSREPAAQRPPITAEYTFVLADHTAENADRIFEGLDEATIIAYEPFFALSDEERVQVNQLMTDAMSRNASDETWDKAVALADTDQLGLLMPLLERFRQSDKQFALIDMAEDHPEFIGRDTYQVMSRQIQDAVKQNWSNEDAKGAIFELIVAAAEAAAVQEPYMVQELEVLGEKNPGVHIGVVLGAAHGGVQTQLAQRASTRAWLAVSEGKPRYDYELQAVQVVLANGTEAVDPDMLNRALLQQFFFSYMSPDLDGRSRGIQIDTTGLQCAEIDVSNIASTVIDHISPSDISLVLERAEEIRTRDRGWPDSLPKVIARANEMNSLLNEIKNTYGAKQNRPD